MVGARPASVDPGCACDHNKYGLQKDASLSNMARKAVFKGFWAGEGAIIFCILKNLVSSAMSSLFTG